MTLEKAPTKDKVSSFVRAVRDGDRVVVERLNALGEYDSSYFRPLDVLAAVHHPDHVSVPLEALREVLRDMAKLAALLEDHGLPSEGPSRRRVYAARAKLNKLMEGN